MPDGERDSDGAARVAGGGLDPDVVEQLLAQNQAVRYAIERDAASQAELFHSRLPLNETGHFQNRLFGDLLNAASQVHFPLGELRFRLARRAAEKLVEGPVSHPQPLAITEILLIHPKAAVVAYFYQLLLDQRNVLRLPVRSQTHYLIFSAVDLESGVIGEGAVEQTQAVRESQFLEQRNLIATADPYRTGRPFAHAVHSEDGRLFERRGIERAGRVALVVVVEEQVPAELFRQFPGGPFVLGAARLRHFGSDHIRRPQLFLHPKRH